MKELTIEEKAQRYDEAIERAKGVIEQNPLMEYLKKGIEYIFPELKESKDERIRKELLNAFKEATDSLYMVLTPSKREAFIAWLERQGEQDNNEDSDILQRFSFYSYKDEPNILYLSGLYVNEEYRNKGIGTKILEVADEVANSLNCHAIRLKTKKNSNAERLYQAHGYNSLRTEEKDEICLEKKGKQETLCDKCKRAQPSHSCQDITELGRCAVEHEQKSTDKVEPTDYNSIDPHFGKPIDKDETKFHDGDWIIHHGTGNIYQVVAVIDNQYQLKYGDNYTVQKCSDVDRCSRLWTIQDAKDGDILATLDHILIFETIISKDGGASYCHYDFGSSTPQFYSYKDDYWYLGKEAKVYPATKEQRDTLMKAMADAGYTFDFEKKELKKIAVPIFNIGDSVIKKHNSDINDFGAFTITDITGGKYWYNDRIICDITKQDEWVLYEPVRQNTAEWSEEDEARFESCIKLLQTSDGYDTINTKWLKSLKDRVQPQPKQEWSEEDKKMLDVIYSCVDSHYDGLAKTSLLIWIKSLKDRYAWKPSGEQMDALRIAIGDEQGSDCCCELRSLLKDLKSL